MIYTSKVSGVPPSLCELWQAGRCQVSGKEDRGQTTEDRMKIGNHSATSDFCFLSSETRHLKPETCEATPDTCEATPENIKFAKISTS